MENKYYQKYKEKLWKEASERYQNLSEEQKEKKVSVSFWTSLSPLSEKGGKKRKLSIWEIIIEHIKK